MYSILLPVFCLIKYTNVVFKCIILDCDVKRRVIDTIQLHQDFIILKDNKVHFQKNYSMLNNDYTFNLSGRYTTKFIIL